MRPNSVNVTAAKDTKSLAVAGDNYTIIITGEQSGGAYTAINMLVPPQGGPGPHAHTHIDETFYVLDGELVFRSETQVYTAKKGDTIHIPKGGAIHCFKNESDQIARVLCLVTPAGLDNFFQEIGEPVANGGFLSPPPMNEATVKRMQTLAEKYGQEVFPPDYFDKK